MIFHQRCYINDIISPCCLFGRVHWDFCVGLSAERSQDFDGFNSMNFRFKLLFVLHFILLQIFNASLIWKWTTKINWNIPHLKVAYMKTPFKYFLKTKLNQVGVWSQQIHQTFEPGLNSLVMHSYRVAITSTASGDKFINEGDLLSINIQIFMMQFEAASSLG